MINCEILWFWPSILGVVRSSFDGVESGRKEGKRALEINGRGLTVKLRINCYEERVFVAALAVVVKKKKRIPTHSSK